MKFKTYTHRNIFDSGELTSLAEQVLSGIPVKEIRRLTTDEMCRIPEIYAHINYTPQNTTSIIDVIDSSAVYKTGNDKDILGSDIKAITSLMYLKPRTAYWKPDKAQIYDSSVCGAVPLVLLGFKRWQNIKYDQWRDMSEVYHLDLLLGNMLASTKYNANLDKIEMLSVYGLANTRGYECRPTYGDVRIMRELNMGNYRGSFANTYGAVEIPEEDNEVFKLHNLCSTAMRLMLSQRWVWYGQHRNTDMIMDFQDWDNEMQSVDQLSKSLQGLEPTKNINTQLKNRFGIG